MGEAGSRDRSAMSKSFEDLRPGDSFCWHHHIRAEEETAFIALSGDGNPLHLDDGFARIHGYRGKLVHGLLVSSFVLNAIRLACGTAGFVCLSQTLKYVKPVYPGDSIEVTVSVTRKSPVLRVLVLDATVTNQAGEVVLLGETQVMVLDGKRVAPDQERSPQV